MTQGYIIQQPSRKHRQGQQPLILGVDLASKPDDVSLVVMGPKGVETVINQRQLNAKCASRKADREFIARALIDLMERHGAQFERRPGFSGHNIVLRFSLNGVGAMVDIDNLHGGYWTSIHWYNTQYPTRDFTTKFCVNVGVLTRSQAHHKATSCPKDWYSLAMCLDAGLCMAARGDAFEPLTV